MRSIRELSFLEHLAIDFFGLGLLVAAVSGGLSCREIGKVSEYINTDQAIAEKHNDKEKMYNTVSNVGLRMACIGATVYGISLIKKSLKKD